MKIALISDTHGLIPEDVLKHLKTVDEVWHAGDIGDIGALDQLPAKVIRHWVWGNIDDHILRRQLPEYEFFRIQGLKFLIIHIGGYPGRFQGKARQLVDEYNPDVFITGHSHILKIMRDHRRRLLHFNPGACGYKGFHKVRTLIKFDLEEGRIHNVEVIEMQHRHKL